MRRRTITNPQRMQKRTSKKLPKIRQKLKKMTWALVTTIANWFWTRYKSMRLMAIPRNQSSVITVLIIRLTVIYFLFLQRPIAKRRVGTENCCKYVIDLRLRFRLQLSFIQKKVKSLKSKIIVVIFE